MIVSLHQETENSSILNCPSNYVSPHKNTVKSSFLSNPNLQNQNQISNQLQIASKLSMNNNIQKNNNDKKVFHKLIQPQIIIPKESEKEIANITPSYFKEPNSGSYGIRCVCGENHTDGLLIQCEHCEFWLHGMCVNIPRLSPNEPYFCPFCLGQRIKCCNKTLKFDEPLIQCSKCLGWMHKNCLNLDYGIIPSNFVCKLCGGDDKYEIPDIRFDNSFPNFTSQLNDINYTEVLNAMPEGLFKSFIENDLNSAELEFKPIIEKYYHLYAPLLLDRPHEFWKVFTYTMQTILKCDKSLILDALDHLTLKLLYNFEIPKLNDVVFSHSDSITDYLEQAPLTRIEKQMENVKLYEDNDGKIKTSVALEDGTFITELPGFLMHTDEVKADKGIPITCILITNSDIVVDLNGSSFTFTSKIKRSFHFNTIAKLIRVKGEVKVALFATRLKGPLSEEKNKRGPAIPKDGEIILPFDGVIPYEVEKIEWKDKKIRKTISHSHENETTKSNVLQNPKKKQKEDQVCNFQLSLLSSFLYEAVPPMPFVILPDQNAVDKYKMLQLVKSHSRGKK